METKGFSTNFVAESLNGYEARDYKWLSFIEKYNFRLLPFTPESIGSIEGISLEFNFDSIVSIDCSIFNDFTGNSLININAYDIKLVIKDYSLFSLVVFSSRDSRAMMIYDRLGFYILLINVSIEMQMVIGDYSLGANFMSYLKDDDYYGKFDRDFIVGFFERLTPYLGIGSE